MGRSLAPSSVTSPSEPESVMLESAPAYSGRTGFASIPPSTIQQGSRTYGSHSSRSSFHWY